MATSKTIKPTNQTVSIPEMTDTPDQSVNSNAISKTIDGLNAIEDRTSGLNVVKTAYTASGVSSVTFDIPAGRHGVVFYAGHMSSLFNNDNSFTTIFSGGDSFADAGFTITKSGSTYTLTRTNGTRFSWAYYWL